MFFTATELNGIRADAAGITQLYAAREGAFRALLGSSWTLQPVEHVKLAFSALLAHELAPAGVRTGGLGLNDLLSSPALDRDGHNILAWRLYEALAEDGFTTVKYLGKGVGGTIASSQLIAETAGSAAALIDPQGAVFGLAPSGNAALTGAPATGVVNLASQPGSSALASAAASSFAGGLLQIDELAFLYHSVSDFVTYGLAVGAFYTPGAANPPDAPLPPLRPGAPGTEPVAQSGGFFSQADLDLIHADAANIAGLYASRRADFLARTPASIDALPEDYLKLAFAGMLAYEYRPYGAHGSVSSFDALLDLQALACSSSSLLAYFLFQGLAPTNPEAVAMVGWNGGHVGNHAQLIIQSGGHDALLVDTTVGHLAIYDDLNAMMSGRRVAAADQASFYLPGTLDWFHGRVTTAFADGLFRAGNLLYQFDPSDAFRSPLIPWSATPTPQGPFLTQSTLVSGHDVLQDWLPATGPVSGARQDGTSGANRLDGAQGSDLLYGLAGDDSLFGWGGDDLMNGGAGNDFYQVTDVNDLVVDSEGVDRVEAYIDYVLPASIENLTLAGALPLAGVGNDLSNAIDGNGSANRLYGGAGDDSLSGFGGVDLLVGGLGNDHLDGGVGVDTMFGGAGADVFVVDTRFDVIGDFSLAEDDFLWSSISLQMGWFPTVANVALVGAQPLTVTGRTGWDVIRGNAGNNTLVGGLGDDIITGGGGKDLVTGGGGLDRFVIEQLADSGVSFAQRDVINTFAHGDKIDLRSLDARTDVAGDQAFAFIGAAAFSGVSGQLRFDMTNISPTGVKAYTVWGDVDGDRAADVSLQIYTAPTADRPGQPQGWNLFAWDFLL